MARRLFHFVAPLALGVFAITGNIGCGGAAQAGFGNSITVLDGASGPMYDELAKRYSVRAYSGEGTLEGSEMLVIDGDTHPPTSLAREKAIQEAFKKGMLIALVDADEEHKASLVDQLSAFGYSNGPSHFFAVRRSAKAGSRFESFEIRKKQHHLKSKEVRFVDGNRVEGQHVEKDVDAIFSSDAVDRLIATTRATRSRDMLFQIPSEIPYIDQTTYEVDSAANAALKGQSVATVMSYEFTGFLNNNGDGTYSQFLVSQAQGELTTGPDLKNGYYDSKSDVMWEGYYQVMAKLTLGLYDQSSLHEPVQSTPLSLFKFGQNQYDSTANIPVSYKDASGNMQTWSFTTTGAFVPLDRWSSTLDTDYSGGVNSLSFILYENSPFDALTGDVSGAVNTDTGKFNDLPSLDFTSIPIYANPLFVIQPPVRGQVQATYSTERNFVGIGIALSGFPYVLAGVSEVTVQDGDAVGYNLRFGQIYPH